ncbi:EP300-interacting inhibitor of differentiation 1 [Psammomys obesus]|uniref:EP300-interacting inhibitor of differentiation 1 n=1 Tax=Psammomys obesus TaxID=48139 RepID=UPI0024535051|nr:EP300-interacting inhibitor of differentiation 1 [Psammomys obesus]
MAEMAELCELYEESNELQMDVLPGEGDAEVGRGARGAEEGPMEEEEEEPPAAARAPRGPLADPEGDDSDGWEDDYAFPEEERWSGAMHRVSAALEEANKAFLRTARPGDALDRGFRARGDKSPFDQLAFIEELFSLMVVNRLTEELGCDEIVDRE